MMIDGRVIATDILADVAARIRRLRVQPEMCVISVAPTTTTERYMHVKEKRAREAGIGIKLTHLDRTATSSEVIDAIHHCLADAVLVQLPLPGHLDWRGICDHIPIGKDADVLSSSARMKFEADEPSVLIPPVAQAVGEILKSGEVEVFGKKAVVVGAGWLVGQPCATWLSHAGANVEVVDVATPHEAFEAAIQAADIIVSGAGSPNLIKESMVKTGAVLIDAGASDVSGSVVGDIESSSATKSLLFTPVPGGVGPVTVAALLQNVVTLAERATS